MSRPSSGGPIPAVTVPQEVEIRAATPADAGEWIRHLNDVAAEKTYIRTERVLWSTREMRKRFRAAWTTEQASIVATTSSRVIGTLSAGRDATPVTRHVASLGMSVDREWRSRGIGSALLAEAFRWARWAGVEKLALTVYPHNQRAINLYKKFGFVEEGRLSGHSRKSYGYEDEVVMGRWV